MNKYIMFIIEREKIKNVYKQITILEAYIGFAQNGMFC